ncbi:MAG: hypothetical protein QXQ53_05985 [Candidatus Methanosuratincola sp.]
MVHATGLLSVSGSGAGVALRGHIVRQRAHLRTGTLTLEEFAARLKQEHQEAVRQEAQGMCKVAANTKGVEA